MFFQKKWFLSNKNMFVKNFMIQIFCVFVEQHEIQTYGHLGAGGWNQFFPPVFPFSYFSRKRWKDKKKKNGKHGGKKQALTNEEENKL